MFPANREWVVESPGSRPSAGLPRREDEKVELLFPWRRAREQAPSGQLTDPVDQFQLCLIARQGAMFISNGPHLEIGHLQELRFLGSDMLHSANDLPVEIAKVVGQDFL